MIDCMTLLSIVSISLPMLLYMQCTAVTKCSLIKRFFLCIFSAKAKGEIQALKTLRKQAFSNAARAGQPRPVPRCPARSSCHGRGGHRRWSPPCVRGGAVGVTSVGPGWAARGSLRFPRPRCKSSCFVLPCRQSSGWLRALPRSPCHSPAPCHAQTQAGTRPGVHV